MPVDLFIDDAGAWNLVRTVGTNTQTSKSANGAAVVGTDYHVVAVFPSAAAHALYINGEAVTLTAVGANISAALVIASGDEVAVGGDDSGGGGDGGGPDWPVPVGAPTTVTTQAAFNTANTAAATGNHIIVNFTPLAAFVPKPGVVYRAFTNQGTTISGNITSSVGGVWFYGFNFATTQPDLATGASTNTFRRCRWTGGTGIATEDGPITVDVRGPDHTFSYCTFDEMRYRRGLWNRSGVNLTVDHCLFKNFTGTTTHQTYEPFATGQGAGDHTDEFSVTVSNSVFVNCNTDTGENEGLSIKSAKNIVTNCLFSDARNMNIRFGNSCEFRSCAIIGDGEVNIHGKNHILNRVTIADTVKAFKFKAGNFDGSLSTNPPTGPAVPSQHPSAYNVKLISCSGKAQVGQTDGDDTGEFRARLIKFWNHTGAITSSQGLPNEWTEDVGAAPESPAAVCSITEAQVGVLGGL